MNTKLVAAGVVMLGVSAAGAWYYNTGVAKCASSGDLAALEEAALALKEVREAQQRAAADQSPAAREALRTAEQKYADAKRRAESRRQPVAATQPADACKG